MKLTEYAGKELLKRYGVPVPEGFIVRSSEGISSITKPMVIKAQVLTGGRGKAGGVRFASNLEQAQRAAKEILGMSISGQVVLEILIEERLNIDREFYVSISLDRASRLPLLMLVKEGGMEVENADPSLVLTWSINPCTGIPDYVTREATSKLVLDPQPSKQLAFTLANIWRLFWEMDCELVEINPLVMTYDGRIIAADAKIVIDDDAIFRHPEIQEQEQEKSSLEIEAQHKGLALVQLDGNVGVIANGAGLTMATLDNLSIHGAKGGVFLDLGGTDDEKVVEDALILMSKAGQRVILVNIFGGITKCDTVAEGLLAAKDKLHLTTPILVRIRGVNEEHARKKLSEKGITALYDLDEACKQAAIIGGR